MSMVEVYQDQPGDLQDLNPRSFPKFLELPKEIQLSIWEAALPSHKTSRIIPIEPYNVGRDVSRIWNSNSISIESPEAWKAFLADGSVQELPTKTRHGNFKEKIIGNEQKLWIIHPDDVILQNLFETCRTSRMIVEQSGFSRTFGVFGDRPTILFVRSDDTFYVGRSVLYDSPTYTLDVPVLPLTRFGPKFKSGWCWDPDRVKNLAIETAVFLHSTANDGFLQTWLADVIACFDPIQVTFVTEYNIGNDLDIESLVFIDEAEIISTIDRVDEIPDFPTDPSTLFADAAWLLHTAFSDGHLPAHWKAAGSGYDHMFHRRYRVLTTSENKKEFIEGETSTSLQVRKDRISLRVGPSSFEIGDPIYITTSRDSLIKDLVWTYSLKRFEEPDDDMSRYMCSVDGVDVDPIASIRSVRNLRNGRRLTVEYHYADGSWG